MCYNFNMETEFVNWLVEEIRKRGWSNSELARRADVVPSTISMILSEQKDPSTETLIGIAHALNVPRERVFRLAGVLAPRIIGDDEVDELLDYFRSLNLENRKIAMTLIHALHDLQGSGEQ